MLALNIQTFLEHIKKINNSESRKVSNEDFKSLILPFTSTFKGSNEKDKALTQSEICKKKKHLIE